MCTVADKAESGQSIERNMKCYPDEYKNLKNFSMLDKKCGRPNIVSSGGWSDHQVQVSKNYLSTINSNYQLYNFHC